MRISKIRSFLYLAARILGDINAIKRGKVKQRVKNRVKGRITSNVFK